MTGRPAESSRVEAFSDGVFAIALTLLVLDLHAPQGGEKSFLTQLLDQWPVYLAYLAAFLNIAAVWVHHHDLFTRVRWVDPGLICANLVLLLVGSLFPWPAAVVSAAARDGRHVDEVTACVLYAGIGFAVPWAWILIYRYLLRAPHLLDGSAGGAAFLRRALRRATVSVVRYPLAALVALVDVRLALVVFAALPVFFIAALFHPGARP